MQQSVCSFADWPGNRLMRILREIIPALYTDFPEGRMPQFELYNIKIDPAETNNLALEMPEKIKELSALYYKKADSFIPPFSSKTEKWKEIMPQVNNN